LIKEAIKILYAIIFLFIFFSISSCKKKSTCQFASVPNSLVLLIKKNNQILTDNILKNIRLSYIENGNKKYITDLTEAIAPYDNKGILTTRNIGTISNGNINTYYIEYPNDWPTDTLYVHYIPPSPATSCIYVEEPVKFNNQLAPVDTSFHFDSPVYILNKQ